MRIKKIALLLIIVLNLGACKNANQKKYGKEIINVSVEEFKKLIDQDKGVLIDVRTPKEVANGYIEGAELLNYFDEDFEEKLTKKSKLKPIYIYCKSGKRSNKAAALFLKNGYYNVHSLTGGFKAWKAAGLNIKK